MFSSHLVREASALAHIVPGAELVVLLRSGRTLHVGGTGPDSPTQHASACSLRQAIVTSADPVGQIDAEITSIRVTGSLRDRGDGRYRRQSPDGIEVWFTTQLDPTCVLDAIAELPETIRESSIDVRIIPDVALGLTAVAVGAAHPSHAQLIEPAADQLFCHLAVAELIQEPADVGQRRRLDR